LALPLFRRNTLLTSQDSFADGSFTLMADRRLRASEAERERNLKRFWAGAGVVLVHILFLIVLLTANHIGAFLRQGPKEVMLLFPPPNTQDKARPALPTVVLPADRPVNIPPTIILAAPPPPSTTENPGDILEALGREIACGAGPYENLSQAQREACKRQPWRYKKNEKGVIVLDRKSTAPKQEEPITGIDVTTQIRNTTDPCVAAGSTHSECIHKDIFGR